MFVERWAATQPSLLDKTYDYKKTKIHGKLSEKKYYILYNMSKNMNAENKDLTMLLVAMVVVLGLVMFMNCGSQNYEPFYGYAPMNKVNNWAKTRPFMRHKTYAEKRAAWRAAYAKHRGEQIYNEFLNSDFGQKYASRRNKPSTNNNPPGYVRTNRSGNYFFKLNR